MNRIEKTFLKLKENKEKALIGFITAGDPSFEKSLEIAKILCQSGVDILELGVPFSDPTADGPVIQRSSMRALKAGMTLEKAFEMAEKIRSELENPIVLFSYYNPLFRYGADKFYRRALEAGIDGVLVVDLPPEESKEFTDGWQELSIIRLIAPTTPESRMKIILQDASGFVYLISKTGVTGSEELLSGKSSSLDYEAIERMVYSVKAFTNLPVCVGFGISTPEQASKIGRFADGVVIGSAFEKAIEENINNKDLLQILEEMARELKRSLLL